LRGGIILFVVLRVSEETENLSNSEADTFIIGRTLEGRYASVDPSNEPNRPQISSVTSDFKERERQNQPEAPYLTGAPACMFPVFSFRLSGVFAVPSSVAASPPLR
jgi:hypothetical protein